MSLWLQLSDGKFATYTGGNGSQALTFAYTSPPATPWPIFRWPGPTPMAVWRSMAVPSSGWRPGNALTGNVATDTHLVIDTMAPTETPPLTATTDNAQTDIGIGHTVTITLDTSEPVTVTGTPTLTLNNGETAHYDVSGSSNDVLTFTYVVAKGDTTPGLQVTGYGGTIQDAEGNGLGPVSGDLVLKIDGDVPATPTVAPTNDTGISSADHITSDPALTFSGLTAAIRCFTR